MLQRHQLRAAATLQQNEREEEERVGDGQQVVSGQQESEMARDKVEWREWEQERAEKREGERVQLMWQRVL